MASLIDLFWLETSFLSLCSSFIFALIMFCICSLWASMADLICSSRRRFSSSCFAIKSFNWHKKRKWFVQKSFGAFLIVFCQTTDRQTYHSEKLVNLVYPGSSIIMYMAFFKVTVEETNGEPTSLSLARRSSSKRAFSSCKMQMKGIQLTFTYEVSSYLHLRFV